ncbi:MAG: hypothetical protein Q4G08_07095 [Capnocytophaga sp.]|nr:hypothetical protein [Capnocytophaga sp.]
MKTKLISLLSGIGIYLLAGTIFYGYHPFMIMTLLVTLPIVAYFITRKKHNEELASSLVWLYAPITALLFVSGLALDAFRAVLPYALLLPLSAILLYYAFTLRHKALAIGIALVAVIGCLSYNSMTNQPENEFDNFEGIKNHIEAAKKSM